MSRKNRFHKQFETDYEFYFSNRHEFTFAGSDIKDSYKIQYPGDPLPIIIDDDGNNVEGTWEIPYSEQGKTAKECFYKLDSEGKRLPCSEPKLLVEILNCKAAINLQIQIWAQSRAEYTMEFFELQEYTEHYKCPFWVLKAVEAQKLKIIREWISEKNWEKPGLYLYALKRHWHDALFEITKDSKTEP